MLVLVQLIRQSGLDRSTSSKHGVFQPSLGSCQWRRPLAYICCLLSHPRAFLVTTDLYSGTTELPASRMLVRFKPCARPTRVGQFKSEHRVSATRNHSKKNAPGWARSMRPARRQARGSGVRVSLWLRSRRRQVIASTDVLSSNPVAHCSTGNADATNVDKPRSRRASTM